MKYTCLLLFCLFLGISDGLKAQSFLGAFAGLSSGKFSGDTPKQFKYGSKINFTFGVGFDWQLKEDIYLSILPTYMNGSSSLLYPKIVDEEEVYEDSIQFNFQTFALPILVKLISDNNRWQFTGGFEFLIPTKLIADDSEKEIDLMDDINKLNLSMLFGIGYIIPLDRSKLVIDLTYSQGLNNIANNLNDPENLLPRIRYTSFRFTLGYYLPVGKNKFSNSSSN